MVDHSGRPDVAQTLGLLRVAGKPWCWELFWYPIGLIPFGGWLVRFIYFPRISVAISKRFGHGGWFARGLSLLGIIFYPILGAGRGEYYVRGPASSAQTS